MTQAEVTVTVHSVKVKELPDFDDDFAQLASEFDTIGELRADTRKRLEAMRRQQQAIQARDRALDALLDQVDVPLPESIVAEEAHRLEHSMHDQIQRAGADWGTYLQMVGKTAGRVQHRPAGAVPPQRQDRAGPRPGGAAGRPGRRRRRAVLLRHPAGRADGGRAGAARAPDRRGRPDRRRRGRGAARQGDGPAGQQGEDHRTRRATSSTTTPSSASTPRRTRRGRRGRAAEDGGRGRGGDRRRTRRRTPRTRRGPTAERRPATTPEAGEEREADEGARPSRPGRDGSRRAAREDHGRRSAVGNRVRRQRKPRRRGIPRPARALSSRSETSDGS